MALYYPSCEWVFNQHYLDWFNKVFNTTDAEEILTESLGPCSSDLFNSLSDPFVYSLIALYCIIIPVGFFGNLCVIWVITTSPNLHKTLNFLLLSLSVSDLILTISLPWTLLFNISYDYTYGEGLCRAVPPIQGTAVMSAIYALLLLAAERYQAILYPTRTRFLQSSLRVAISLCLVWIISLCFQIPQIIVLDDYTWSNTSVVLKHRISYQVTVHVCGEDWSTEQAFDYSIAILVFMYAMPLILLIILYSRVGYFIWFRRSPGNAISVEANNRDLSRRKKILLMLVLMVTIFGVCWGPYFISMPICIDGNCSARLVSYFQWLGHANVALDPLLYAFLHVRVREQFVFKVRKLQRHLSAWRHSTKLKRSNAIRIDTVKALRVHNNRPLNVASMPTAPYPTDWNSNSLSTLTAKNYRPNVESQTEVTILVTPHLTRKPMVNETSLPGMT